MTHWIALYHLTIAAGPWWQAAVINTLLVPLLIVVLGLGIRLVCQAALQLLSLIVHPSAALIFANTLTYPGVVHHELAHALLAWLLGAKIQRITLRPTANALGSVNFLPRGGRIRQSLQLTLSAIAPVLFGVLTLYLIGRFLWSACTAIPLRVLVGYLAVSIFLHMDLSGQDVRTALGGLPVCLMILFIIFIFWRVDLLAGLRLILIRAWQ